MEVRTSIEGNKATIELAGKLTVNALPDLEAALDGLFTIESQEILRFDVHLESAKEIRDLFSNDGILDKLYVILYLHHN